MSRKDIQGQCRLCHVQGRLVDSHIIPNFHFREMKGLENQFFVLSTDPSRKEIRKQKGITEFLLCAQCDNVRLSQYEDHLRRVLFGGHPLDGKQIGGRFLVVRGYDYKKLKNGLLSILWRMGVSTAPYFSEVDLGEKHEERLRIALLNDREFDEEEYPIVVTAPTFDTGVLGHCILPPDFTRAENNRVYRCVISGLVFTFFVGSAPVSKMALPFILRRKSWPIPRAKVEEIPFLFDAVVRLGRANIVRDKAALA